MIDRISEDNLPLTERQAAERLGVSLSTLRRRRRAATGLGSARFHDLRHTYITRVAEAGVPIPVIEAQVGHLSAAMVAHYTHISQGAIHRAAEQIEANSHELLQQMAKFEALQQPAAGFV